MSQFWTQEPTLPYSHYQNDEFIILNWRKQHQWEVFRLPDDNITLTTSKEASVKLCQKYSTKDKDSEWSVEVQ